MTRRYPVDEFLGNMELVDRAVAWVKQRRIDHRLEAVDDPLTPVDEILGLSLEQARALRRHRDAILRGCRTNR